jgi:ribonucleoside-diphosphate reductase alpha chain
MIDFTDTKLTAVDELAPWAEKTARSKRYIKERDGNWLGAAERVAGEVFGAFPKPDLLGDIPGRLAAYMACRYFMPGGRYWYASGNPYHQTQNCLLLRVHDSREGWAELVQKSAMALMSGAGIGVDYSGLREEGAIIKQTGGEATGPIALMQIVNEQGRGIMQGGSRRSAIWAGLNWRHPDAQKLVHVKDWSDDVKELKAKDYSFPATLDQTNISILLDDVFFQAIHDRDHSDHSLAKGIYREVVRQMLTTAEPGFSIDIGDNAGETLRNACTEVTSRDSDDICNLGSINMGRVHDLEEFKQLVKMSTVFLLAGTIYSDVPYFDADKIRDKNRRLGLGVMGVHEWLLKRGKRYGEDDELGEWLDVFRKVSRKTADKWADKLRISRPIAVNAIAPTGTISIVAETTSGIEPLFCSAYKRRWLKGGNVWVQDYVVDPVAKRLVAQGVDPDQIEDAYSIAEDVERRVAFQAWVQQFVDQGISSTINLPQWGSPHNNERTVKPFGDMLLNYLPRLRGITCYPDGARGGQPLVPMPYRETIEKEGVEEVATDICDITKGGSCGD